jgi:hypothetical protein
MAPISASSKPTCNIDNGKRHGRARHIADDDVVSLLRDFQHLDLGIRVTKKRIRHKDVGPEFASYYGINDCVKEGWQALCRDCGVDPLPSSIKKCKKVQPLSGIQSACA